MKKTLFAVMILLVLGVFSNTLFAAEVVIFGPIQYVRTTQSPNVFTDSFVAPFPDTLNQGVLIIENGDKNDKHRVTSAEIALNGNRKFSSNDFKKKNHLLSLPVDLVENNTIQVTLKSKPDTYLSIRVIQDIDPPAVSINSTPDAVKVNEDATLSWSSSLAETCSIVPDVGIVPVMGSFKVSPDKTTTYTITATGPGGTSTASTIVTHINSAPMAVDDTGTVVMETPLLIPFSLLIGNDTDVDGDDLTVSGFTQPSNGTVTDNGDETLTYTPVSGYFGTDYFTYTASDGNGGTSLAGVAISVICPPSISIIEPDGIEDIVDAGFYIQWSDSDPDDSAMISLYFDNDESGVDGTLIVNGLNEDPDGPGNDEYLWDTALLTEGAYYVYAVIDDGRNDPVVAYSDGALQVDHGLSGEAKLTADDASAYDRFAWSASVNGDYAIVGAYNDGVNGYGSGSAYVFKANGAAWIQEAKLTASDASTGAQFGWSVSISGDYAIVGANTDHDSGKYSGSAYIFKRDDTIWTQEAKLLASDGASYDYFGCSVSISGNYAVVGAYGNDDGGSGSGSAYVFKREGATWTQEAKLLARDAASGDQFGYSVSIRGNYVMVGAQGDDDRGNSAGSAYMFKRDGSLWTEQAKLLASDGEPWDSFGISVSTNGDYAIVGAYSEDDGGSFAGAAYMFKREDTTWTEQTKLIASDAAEGDAFGISVSINSEYAVVGAYGDDDGADLSGAAYIFMLLDEDWVELVKITPDEPGENARFGGSCAISDEYVVVGAYGHSDGGRESGAAYAYLISGL